MRILPKVQFGAHPLGLDEMGPDSPDVAVLHHFVGTWKKKGGWGLARELSPTRLMNRLLGYLFDLPDECAPNFPVHLAAGHVTSRLLHDTSQEVVCLGACADVRALLFNAHSLWALIVRLHKETLLTHLSL